MSDYTTDERNLINLKIKSNVRLILNECCDEPWAYIGRVNPYILEDPFLKAFTNTRTGR